MPPTFNTTNNTQILWEPVLSAPLPPMPPAAEQFQIMSETLLNTAKKASIQKPKCFQHSQMQNLVAYTPLKLKKTATNAYEKTHTLLNKPFNWTEHSDELIGIEIEVENIKDVVPIEVS